MLARSIIIRLTIVVVGLITDLKAAPGGKIVCSNGDGTFDTEKQPEYAGFPTFKEWKITYDGTASLPLLEATVISTNTGSPVQDKRIFLQYGKSKPIMLAISDADGKVKMRIQMKIKIYQMENNKQLRNDKTEELTAIYIGDPNLKGSFSRIFNAFDIQTEKGEPNSGGNGE